MRTIEMKAYKASELDPSAFSTAYNAWLRGFDYPWYSDVDKCRKGLLELFPGAYLDRDNDVRTGQMEDTLLELKGKRLAAWINTNVVQALQKGKYRSMITYSDAPHKRVKREESKATGNKWRYYRSAITFTVECPFSGMSVDCAALEPLLNYAKGSGYARDGRQWASVTLEELIGECFHAIKKYVEDDIEYLSSDEMFKEDMDANEVEFDESGRVL
jgi:hypothetical protein